MCFSTYFILIALFLCQPVQAFKSKSPSEINLVKRQLGYLPPNFRCVSAWTQDKKSPVAIQTYPLQDGVERSQPKATNCSSPVVLGTPFPTLYWLSNPDISRAVADLERRGYVTLLKQKLNNSPQDSSRLLACHEQYSKKRWNSLSREDKSLLMSEHPSVKRMRHMIECSGVAGLDYLSHIQPDGSFLVSFKCLHAHYAHYRSEEPDENLYNPVGLWVHELLQEQFPDVSL